MSAEEPHREDTGSEWEFLVLLALWTRGAVQGPLYQTGPGWVRFGRRRPKFWSAKHRRIDFPSCEPGIRPRQTRRHHFHRSPRLHAVGCPPLPSSHNRATRRTQTPQWRRHKRFSRAEASSAADVSAHTTGALRPSSAGASRKDIYKRRQLPQRHGRSARRRSTRERCKTPLTCWWNAAMSRTRLGRSSPCALPHPQAPYRL